MGIYDRDWYAERWLKRLGVKQRNAGIIVTRAGTAIPVPRRRRPPNTLAKLSAIVLTLMATSAAWWVMKHL